MAVHLRIVMTNGGVVAAKNKSGRFTILTIERGHLALGENVQGEFTLRGGRAEIGATTVTVEDLGCSREKAIDLLCDLNPGGDLQILGEAGI